MVAYYNEIDPFAAAWLRNLIAAGHIAPGEVDERSIADVLPTELSRYTQCHFFAGLGVWSYALRRAGWPDDRPVWTGSCPCQPFSAAGRGEGFADERHLWPAFHHLIGQCRPPVVFGEQVASKAVDPWIDLVQADMEAVGYAFGAVAFPAAGVGAPHIRDRTYFVADAAGGDVARVFDQSSQRSSLGGEGMPDRGRRDADVLGDALGARLEGQRRGHQAESGYGRGALRPASEAGEPRGLGDAGRDGDRQHARELSGHEGQHEVRAEDGDYTSFDAGELGGLADSSSEGRRSERPHSDAADCAEAVRRGAAEPGRRGATGKLADADRAGAQRRARDDAEASGFPSEQRRTEDRADVSERGSADHDGRGAVRGHGLPGHNSGPGPTNGIWRDADWLFCRDGRWRPVRPGSSPLAHGIAGRVAVRRTVEQASTTIEEEHWYSRGGALRGVGNAICSEAAVEFIGAYLDAEIGA